MSAPLHNQEKAAVLMTNVGVTSAARILQHLPEDLVEALTYRVTQLGGVAPEVGQAVLDELVTIINSNERPSFGGLDYAVELLDRAVDPDAATKIAERIRHTEEKRPLSFLAYVHPSRIAALLRGESAQTLALVLVNLPSSVAASVLSLLPQPVQAEVTLRIATLGEVSPLILKTIDAQLQRLLANTQVEEIPPTGGVARLAEILRYAGAAAEHAVLDHLDEHEHELAAEVRERLFTFEDIVKLDDRSLQLVLREIDRNDLVLALRGTDAQLQERIFANVSKRAAALLQDDLRHQPRMPGGMVKDARGRLVAKAHEMEEAGLLTLPRGDEELVD